MQLKKALGAVALGVTVLTAVPALVVPQAAAAADCYTSCDPWDDPNNVNDPIVVTGPNTPPTEGWPFPWHGGGGGAASAHVYSYGEKGEDKQFCRQNSTHSPEKLNVTVQVATGYKVTASLSAEALNALKAAVGAEVNTTTTTTHSVDVTLQPGQSFGVFAQYQTVTYSITLPGGQTQLVDVQVPTNTIIDHSCS
ncbi:DUF6426 family protein [Kitasatospora sp. A2-31]|uniref:DUF6426 family protein n=1 Tax=Kitasatospora sp. A2-31 TaxID=2916414 RepID=UPI001EEE86ED|nr:DUF6426 family protein [Kitasatospora sp. A2-31]MCG6499841.1 hypothetical protein [Kitasatospora sp. A2-31]MCG6499849.1 hypothetical protein [Kitasatospora sp. A2-31]